MEGVKVTMVSGLVHTAGLRAGWPPTEMVSGLAHTIEHQSDLKMERQVRAVVYRWWEPSVAISARAVIDLVRPRMRDEMGWWLR